MRVGPYEGVLRDAILEAKQSAHRALAHALGVELGAQLQRVMHGMPSPLERCVIVPVPTSFRRRMLRGIDHTLAIARGVRARTGWELAPILQRSHAPHQTGQSLRVRQKNVAQTMRSRPLAPDPAQFAGATLLIVDDVMTSGATLREASRALRAWASSMPPELGPKPALWACPVSVVEPSDRTS